MLEAVLDFMVAIGGGFTVDRWLARVLLIATATVATNNVK
jgi:hypothetical protein